MPRVIGHAAVDEQPRAILPPLDDAHPIQCDACPRHEAAPRLQMQDWERQTIDMALAHHTESYEAHVLPDIRLRQLVVMIRHAPAAPRAEMPLLAQVQPFHEVERRI